MPQTTSKHPVLNGTIKNPGEVKKAVADLAVLQRKGIKVLQSDQKRYTVTCLAPACPFYIRAAKDRDGVTKELRQAAAHPARSCTDGTLPWLRFSMCWFFHFNFFMAMRWRLLIALLLCLSKKGTFEPD